MEAVILVGIQAAGKSTFCREHLFDTHVRISLDMVRTRRRERILMEACIAAGQRFVIDNTSVTAEERARYLAPARTARFRTIGYFFEPDPQGSVRRNAARTRRVPPAGIFGTLKRLEPPTLAEGFDEMYTVRIGEQGWEVRECVSA
jgi:predicted kinase